MTRKSEMWRNLRGADTKDKRKEPKAPIHDHDYSKIFPEEAGFRQSKSIRLKNKFDHVRTLIQNEKYKEARRELLKINHPTAEKWLDQLDEIAPEYRALSPFEVRINIFDFIILLVIISGIIVLTVMEILPIGIAIGIVFFVSIVFLLFFWFRGRR